MCLDPKRTAHLKNPMAIKTRIWWDVQTQAYVVSSAYSDKLVEALKHVIPSSDRTFDPHTKFWYVKEAYGDFVREMAQKAFGIHSVSFTSKTVTQQSQQRSPVVSTQSLDSVLTDFVKLLSYDAAKAAYRRAALDLHPDRADGDAQKMSRLNEVWSRIEKEVFKK